MNCSLLAMGPVVTLAIVVAKKMGPPCGERHGKGKRYPDWLVAAVRMEHYDYGVSVKEIVEILNIPEATVRQWINFYSRVERAA